VLGLESWGVFVRLHLLSLRFARAGALSVAELKLPYRYDLYKVETVGDTYMVVGGIPDENVEHTKMICNLALDLLETVCFCLLFS